jgi:hypothetical protein
MMTAQMELSLGNQRMAESPRANGRAPARASRWWFQRMRQVVDRAFDWQPAPPPRPEQIWLPGTHRRVSVNS